MDPSLWIAIALMGLLLLVPLLVLPFAYVRVESGKALVVNKLNRSEVYFVGGLVMPIVHRGETIDMSPKTISIDRRGKEGIICRDRIRADVAAQFHVRINRTQEDVLRVAHGIGCARAGDQATLEQLFSAKFAEALETAASQLDFEELSRMREEFREQVFAIIGRDLDGYVLDDIAIDRIEQTPLEVLDPNNILDAEGIKKIVEITEERGRHRAEIEAAARRRRLELDTLVAELEHRKADALGRFQRDIGRPLTEADLRARIAALLVEHYGPRIDASAAQALVATDADADG